MNVLLDLAPIPTIIIEGDTIAYANEAMGRLMGLPRATVVGWPWARLLAPDVRDRIRTRYERRRAGEPEPTVYESAIVVSSGRRVPIETHVSAVPGGVMAQFIDLTDRTAHLERLELMARIGPRLLGGSSRDEILRIGSRGLVQLGLGCMRLRREGSGGVVEAFDVPDHARAVLRAAGLEGEPVGRRFESAPGEWRHGTLFLDDAPGAAAVRLGRMGASIRHAARAAGFLRAVALEIGDPDGTVVVIIGNWITLADVPAFRLFGAQVASALLSGRALTEVRSRNRLVEVAATAHSLPEFFARGSEEVQRILDCDAVAVWLHEAGSGELVLGHFRGDSPDLVAPYERIPLARAPHLSALLAGGPARFLHAADLPPRTRARFERAGIASYLTVPLRIRSTIVGVMSAGFRNRHDERSRSVEVLGALAAPFAAAVESQRLLDDLRGRVAELEMLNATAVASATLDLRAMLGEALSSMLRTFGADGGAGYLLEGGWLVRQVTSEADAATQRDMAPRLPAEEGPAAEALRTLQPVPLPAGALAGGSPLPGSPERGFATSIAVPLVVKNRALGVFTLGRRRAVPFRPEEARLLATVAAQVGVAVENARLFEDLTRSYVDLGRAQKQLVHRERLAALGELSAVVAHEVRNPLAAIFNSLGSLQRILQPHGDAKMLLTVIQEEADRLNRTVGDLLDFARPAEPSLRLEPLAQVVEDSLSAALAHGAAGVEIVRDHAPDLPLVAIDARQVRQAVLNLAVNALQAMPGGGRLTVRTRADVGGGARVEVADTGHGIPAELRARIFEPFFTTKPTGTGLGLAVVRRIAESHGGTIEAGEEPGGGTRFVLRVPASARDAAEGWTP